MSEKKLACVAKRCIHICRDKEECSLITDKIIILSTGKCVRFEEIKP